MNKVMVVDDEKLVRQGIISTFPWGKHGFEVTCDAPSGEKALELLKHENIDLLVTDLAMNGMSGLELIRKAREIREDLPVVILTCHDNFSYIQEAMRLGVLDYIVKTEIEDEVVDETLTRISGKLEEAKRSAHRNKAKSSIVEMPHDGLLLCGPTRSSMPADVLGEFDREDWAGQLASIDTATWFLQLPRSDADKLSNNITLQHEQGQWICVHITGDIDSEVSALFPLLKRYRRRVLFYDESNTLQKTSWSELFASPLLNETLPGKEAALVSLRKDWDELGWVYSDERFEHHLKRTREAVLEVSELRSLFYPVALEWERLLNVGSMKQLIEQADDWLFWHQCVRWLRELRTAIRKTVERNATLQAADLIFRAIEKIRARDDLDITEAEIAKAVNMSRTYFSKTFKRVTGRSYGEYVRQLKLERAKEMILRTDEPITRVAEICGFQDYRYFSRIFRQYTGKTPTEFRSAGA